MASAVESMPPPMALPHQSPSPAPDQSAYRPSSRSGNHSHPYAIVTSSSALLTRTNSTGHGKSKVAHSYTPASPSTPSRIITNPHNRTHRHTRSMSSVVPPPPLPIPPSPSTPSRMADHWGSGNVSDGGIPRPKRSETMPVFPNSPTKETEIKIADLPDNPKVWTPTQLSVYLASALRVKGVDKLPAPVAKDIAAFILKERIAGRVFLRLTEEDLEEKGINRLWRNALLSAARSLRKKVLKGRIWGFGGPPAPEAQQRQPSTVPEGAEHEDESGDSETPDKPSLGGYRRGRVRGMVETFERSSSSASSGSSAGHRSPIDLDMDNLPDIDVNDEAIRDELRAAGLWDSDSQDEDAGFGSSEQESPLNSEPAFVFPPAGDNTNKAVLEAPANSDAEPSMEELLSREAQNEANEAAWGARAWELDADLAGAGTARRVVDTIQPSSRKGSSKRLKNSRPPTIKGVPVTDVFGAPEAITGSVPIASQPSPDSRQDGPAASEVIAAFKVRLDEIERRLAEMEKKDEERDRERAQELERQQALAEAARTAARESKVGDRSNTLGSLPSSPSLTSMMLGLVFPKLADRLGTRSPSLSPRPSVQNISSDVQPHPTKRKRAPNDQVSDLTPAALPQYVLLVGLGVCAVILRVLLRRVSGKR